MAEITRRVAALVGDVLQIADTTPQWPALGELTVGGAVQPVALYLAPVGPSGRRRDAVERRIQNPGSNHPIVDVPGRQSLLLGLWQHDQHVAVTRPLLVSADPQRRLGNMTRVSVFERLPMLMRALETGWAEWETSSNETMRAFLPSLLPLSAEIDRSGSAVGSAIVEAAIESSGLLDEAGGGAGSQAAERMRKVGSRLARDAHFSRAVIDAYRGLCAMCGLDVGLVQGAHIYPVAAPSAPDEPWNGLALCGNHHLAFDKHVVAVRSATREIVFRQAVLDQVPTSKAVRALVKGTFDRLAEPSDRRVRPRQAMFDQRHAFFEESYAWLP